MDCRTTGECRRQQRRARRIAFGHHGRNDIGENARDPVKGERVDDRVCRFSEKSFEAVRQRVDCGGGDQARRERARQIRVAQRDARHHQGSSRAGDRSARLPVDRGDRRTLASCANGRGDRDQRHYRADPVVPADDIGRLAAKDAARGHELGRVEDRSAAQRDHAVTFAGAILRCRGIDPSRRGIRRHVEKGSAAGDERGHLGDESRRLQAPIADEQRPADAEQRQFGGQAAESARAEHQPR